jgi:hypothetical protein
MARGTRHATGHAGHGTQKKVYNPKVATVARGFISEEIDCFTDGTEHGQSSDEQRTITMSSGPRQVPLPPNAPLERYDASRPARHIEMLVSKCGMQAGARSTIVGESGGGHRQWRLGNGYAVNKHAEGLDFEMHDGYCEREVHVDTDAEEALSPKEALKTQRHMEQEEAIARKKQRKSARQERKQLARAELERKAALQGIPAACAAGCKDKHMMPHSRELMQVVCRVCGRAKRIEKVPQYNLTRRKLRAAEELVSLTAKIHMGSAEMLAWLVSEYGLSSNTAVPHVTFVEGLKLPLPSAELHELCLALEASPVLRLTGAISVPTLQKDTELVCLSLEVPSRLAHAAHQLGMHEGCLLPQWPLHVALGVGPTTQARHVAELLTGRELPRVHASDCAAPAALRVTASTLAALAVKGQGAPVHVALPSWSYTDHDSWPGLDTA